MQKYILTTNDKLRFILDENEKNAIAEAVVRGDKQAIIHGEMIPLNIAPTIVKFERWYAQENLKLAASGRRLCKKCLSAMDVSTGCMCWERNGGVKQHGIEGVPLPPAVLDRLHGTIKSFPKLSE